MSDPAHDATDHPPEPAWEASAAGPAAAPSEPVTAGAPGFAESSAPAPQRPAAADGAVDAGTSSADPHERSLDEEMEHLAEEFAAAAEADPAALADADPAAAAVEVDLDLARTAAERDEYLDALRRLQADFENYKKRVVRQQTETLDRAGEDLVTKLLPVLDTVDLARRHGAGDALEQVAAALLDVLAKEGLERVDPAGEPFDPTEHDAVAHEEGDGGPAVSEVLRAGYRWRGRLLRPAMVKVQG